MRHLIAILAAAGASASVLPTDAAANDALEQIIVTGARTPIVATDLGSAVTIITRDDIDARQARYVSDLLRGVPGFAVSHSGVVGSQTQVRVRGSEANHVLVLIDGVRANDPATGDEFRWEYLATANIERIEIVRGPQSALWGSDAVGGVVHIITRTGEGPGLDGYLEGGSRNTRNGGLSGSLGGDTWTIAVGAEQLTTDGFNISRTGDEHDDAEITSATVNARFTPREALAFDIGLRSVDAYSQYDGVDWYVTGLPTDSDVATDTAQLYAHFGATVGTSEQRVHHRFNVHHFDSDNRNLVDGSPDISTASERRSVAYQADLGLGKNRLAIGLEHETTSFEQRGAVVFDDPNQDQSMNVTSVVADFQGRGKEAVTWLLSARYDDSSDFDDIVTGRASLAWHVGDATTLRASIGSGQKTPTFIERFGYYAQSFEGNPGLQPERSTSYDIGSEDEINGFQCPNPWPAPCTAVNMDGKSRRSGVEVGASWSVVESLDFALTYTYTNSKDAESAAELRRPRHSGSLHANYRFMDQRGQLSLAADYGGARQDVFYPPWPDPSEIVTLDNYWLVDIALQYRVSDALTMFARGSNLLDTEYEQVYGYRTPGRAWYGGVRLSFGR